MNAADRVRQLVETGAVAPEEGERLLTAMNRDSNRPRRSLLINPFERFGGGVATAVGAIVSALSLGLAQSGVRFDGFLDLHIAKTHPPTLALALGEQVCAWLLPAACFFVYARTRSKNVRAVDFLGMVGLARLPLFLAGVAAALLSPDVSLPPKMTPAFLATLLFGLAGAAGMMTWLYQGFKNASGFSDSKVVGQFVGITVVAEVLSKLARVMFV